MNMYQRKPPPSASSVAAISRAGSGVSRLAMMQVRKDLDVRMQQYSYKKVIYDQKGQPKKYAVIGKLRNDETLMKSGNHV